VLLVPNGPAPTLRLMPLMVRLRHARSRPHRVSLASGRGTESPGCVHDGARNLPGVPQIAAETDDGEEDTFFLSALAAQLYLRCLQLLPALVRMWWTSCERSTSEAALRTALSSTHACSPQASRSPNGLASSTRLCLSSAN
jgi:hypothetical protein